MTKLSIIIPTYNSEKTLEAALNSIWSQTFKDYEVWIIDGLSTDNTISIVKEFAFNDSRVKWISEQDKGIYDAMNKGIDLAKGEWLYFLGSDDRLYNNEILAQIFSKGIVKTDVIYGSVLFKHSKVVYDGRFNYGKFLKKNICHQSIFLKKRIFSKVGKFNLKYKMLADWEHNMRWFPNNKYKKRYIDLIVAIYNEDGSCFNIPDKEFVNDFNRNVKKYFPAHIRYLKEMLGKRFIGRIAYFFLKTNENELHN